MEAFSDFSEFFELLNAHEVQYLIIGGVAYNFHAEPRQTKDIDVWVAPTRENVARLRVAIAASGYPVDELDDERLLGRASVVMLGVPPWRIDVLMRPKGVEFPSCLPRAVPAHYGAVPVRVLGRDDLIAAKLAAGRPQDLVDIAHLRDMAADE